MGKTNTQEGGTSERVKIARENGGKRRTRRAMQAPLPLRALPAVHPLFDHPFFAGAGGLPRRRLLGATDGAMGGEMVPDSLLGCAEGVDSANLNALDMSLPPGEYDLIVAVGSPLSPEDPKAAAAGEGDALGANCAPLDIALEVGRRRAKSSPLACWQAAVAHSRAGSLCEQLSWVCLLL